MKKSCDHKLHEISLNETRRRVQAGYPLTLLSFVAETMLKEKEKRNRDKDQKIAVIPYVHGISHILRKIGRKAGVEVLSSAPDRLSSLCKRVNKMVRNYAGCATNHRGHYVSCADGVVYSIPSSCGRAYTQAEPADARRLSEHNYNVTKRISCHLGIHCRYCGCTPQLSETSVLRR